LAGPVDDLKHEHELIKRMLGALEAASERLARGERVPPDLLDDARAFVRGFADECHHGKEEQALFPLLAKRSDLLRTGPVRILASEHDVGRKLMAELAEATDEMRAGVPKAEAHARRTIDLYTRMLRRHIEKEERILFPLAEMQLKPADEAALTRQFEAIEARMGADAHARYEAIVRRLEEAVALPA